MSTLESMNECMDLFPLLVGSVLVPFKFAQVETDFTNKEIYYVAVSVVFPLGT